MIVETKPPAILNINIKGLRYKCKACGINLNDPEDNTVFAIWEKRVRFHMSACPKTPVAVQERATFLNDLIEPLFPATCGIIGGVACVGAGGSNPRRRSCSGPGFAGISINCCRLTGIFYPPPPPPKVAPPTFPPGLMAFIQPMAFCCQPCWPAFNSSAIASSESPIALS